MSAVISTRGRKPGFRMDASHRAKIANSKILSRLIGHVEGTVELSATQVSAGIALLKKVMPDMIYNQHGGDEDNPISIVTRIELVAPNGNGEG